MKKLIYLEDALDAIQKERDYLVKRGQIGAEHILTHHAYNVIAELPSAEPKPWEYDEDCGCVMCRCPKCSGRRTISLYQYKNPYKFCPYCGQALTEGKLAQKRKQVYGEGVRRNDNNRE